MSSPALDVMSVGNAIVDVLANADDAFLNDHNIPKGGMILIDEEQAAAIYGAMGSTVEVSGGSAANSSACIASLGGRAGFVGKVSDDTLGNVFRHDLNAIGVAFNTAPLADGPATGRCLVNVTPDAQRSMTTFLGAAGFVSPDDIDQSQVDSANITFFEGYLFEQPVAREAFIKACDIAKKAGRRAAITLSDKGCVERQFDAFHAFIGDHVDILLANEDEAAALFQTEDEAEQIEKARALCPLTAITRSEKGSLLIPRDGDVVEVGIFKPAQLVDTTGAGDAYAAGLLYGLSMGIDLHTAGSLGALAASEVISHFGARPQKDLKVMGQEAGLLKG